MEFIIAELMKEEDPLFTAEVKRENSIRARIIGNTIKYVADDIMRVIAEICHQGNLAIVNMITKNNMVKLNAYMGIPKIYKMQTFKRFKMRPKKEKFL